MINYFCFKLLRVKCLVITKVVNWSTFSTLRTIRTFPDRQRWNLRKARDSQARKQHLLKVTLCLSLSLSLSLWLFGHLTLLPLLSPAPGKKVVSKHPVVLLFHRLLGSVKMAKLIPGILLRLKGYYSNSQAKGLLTTQASLGIQGKLESCGLCRWCSAWWPWGCKVTCPGCSQGKQLFASSVG